MKTSPALHLLLRKLAIIGIDPETYEVVDDKENEGYAVNIDFPNGNRIAVLVQEFWRYPGTECYFVNFRHTGGNFQCCMGTPHIEQALVNFGSCQQQFVWPHIED
jgi:hypothetical protein